MAYKQPYKSAILRVDPPDDPTSSFRQGVDRDQTRKEVRAGDVGYIISGIKKANFSTG